MITICCCCCFRSDRRSFQYLQVEILASWYLVACCPCLFLMPNSGKVASSKYGGVFDTNSLDWCSITYLSSASFCEPEDWLMASLEITWPKSMQVPARPSHLQFLWSARTHSHVETSLPRALHVPPPSRLLSLSIKDPCSLASIDVMPDAAHVLLYRPTVTARALLACAGGCTLITLLDPAHSATFIYERHAIWDSSIAYMQC